MKRNSFPEIEEKEKFLEYNESSDWPWEINIIKDRLLRMTLLDNDGYWNARNDDTIFWKFDAFIKMPLPKHCCANTGKIKHIAGLLYFIVTD